MHPVLLKDEIERKAETQNMKCLVYFIIFLQRFFIEKKLDPDQRNTSASLVHQQKNISKV